MPELPDDIYERITALSQEGNDLLDESDFSGALAKYEQAWDLLPDPKEDWEAATWILSAIGDTYFYDRRFDDAINTLSKAIHCPNGLGNPFIHLRLGESRFEAGDRPRAADELTRAYMGAGREIFENEDPKYFDFLKTVLKPPRGQKEL